MDRRDFLRTGLVLGITTPLAAACTATPTNALAGDPSPATPQTGPMSITSPTPETNTPATNTPGTNTAGTNTARTLLAFFSRPGENYYYGDRIDLDTGNTQVVADMIAAAITPDTFRIEAADPYPDDYEQTVARNVQEERDEARPAITGPLPDVAGYDTILLGCPVWNSQTPMIMRTFVDGLDLTGKTVHPFVTYAVSGMGRVRDDYVALLPDNTITEGLAIRGEEATQAGSAVTDWLRRLNLLPA